MTRKIQPIILAIIRENGKYLFTKRIQTGTRFHNKWQSPGGGMRFGETAEQTLFREVKEELGIDIEIVSMFPKTFTTIRRKDWQALAIPFFCRRKNKRQKIQLNEEASEFGWFNFKEIENLDLMPLEFEILSEAEKLQ